MRLSLALIIGLVAMPSISWCADGAKRHLACSRGDIVVCRALAAQPRMSPGPKAAVEEKLAEIGELAANCDRRDRNACSELLSRYPLLPSDMRAAAEDNLRDGR